MAFSYMLRVTIAPGFHETEKVEPLLRFCQQAAIDDVMFFTSCGELDQGHPTLAELRPWLETIGRVGATLQTIGVSTSINPLTTLRHSDHGRMLKPGQSFECMVDSRGLQSEVTPCPLCPEFGTYLAAVFALYASAKPATLWVEDDFRLHNHVPLDYGGCFCERHLAEYSKRAGRRLTRAEFVSAMLAPGEPHPYRTVWLDVARDAMVALAARIGSAVHAVSPTTRVGLMSSHPMVHCSEARDWRGILMGLAGPHHAPVLRPHLPAYREPPAPSYLIAFNEVARQARALIPVTTECYPELENYPHSRFTKSRAFSSFQITSSLALGVRGITLNIFDMMGNGVQAGQGYEAMLAEIKPFGAAVAELGLESMTPQGIQIPVCPTSSYTLHTERGERIEEVYPAESLWSGILSSYGIANAFCAAAPQQLEQGCVAVSGQYFRNLAAAAITSLFERHLVILDGEAAQTLLDLGLGELAGLQRARWQPLNRGRHAYEQVCDGELYCGFSEARLSLQETGCEFLDIDYRQAPALKTQARNPAGEVVAPGIAVVNHRVLIFPYGRYGAGPALYLQPVRQAITQAVLRALPPPQTPFFVVGEPYVSLYVFRSTADRRMVWYLTNASLDDVSELTVCCPGLRITDVLEISRRGRAKAELAPCGDSVVLRTGLRGLESKALVFSDL
jgi:hypothetical protein